jgi:hypothetical protein
MKLFTKNNLAHIFQILAVILLFGYAAFPDKKMPEEKTSGEVLQVDKNYGATEQALPPVQNNDYLSAPPQQLLSNGNFIWLTPGNKHLMKADLKTQGKGSKTKNTPGKNNGSGNTGYNTIAAKF